MCFCCGPCTAHLGDKQGSRRREDYSYSIKKKTKNKKKIDFFSDVPTLLKSQNIQYQKD